MKRIVWLVALIVFLPGCESKPPFKDKFEEFEFLQSLSNPTPQQFKRRKELAGQPDVAHDAKERTEIDKMFGRD